MACGNSPKPPELPAASLRCSEYLFVRTFSRYTTGTITVSDISSVLILHSSDNIAVARRALRADESLTIGTSVVKVTEPIPVFHKVAAQLIPKGSPIRKFGQPIGSAACDIAPGQWVHTHNVSLDRDRSGYEFCTDLLQFPTPPARTFQGYRRRNGSAGTRNYIAVISTVNCSATTSRYVAQELARTDLSRYPNIDGVIPIVHKSGCAFAYNSDDHLLLNRTLAGFARHPNIAACIVLGLGCETAQASHLQQTQGLVQLGGALASGRDDLPMILNIQEVGGVRKTVDRAVSVLREMLPAANDVRRVPIPLAELTLGLQCGGSDGASGITANPALGYASDLLVAHGAGSVLAETPEVYGAEQLLTRRSISREVGEKLLERIRWWEDYARRNNASIDNNPSYGNKQGGLTTIIEKSLGAVAKGGTAPLRDVYQFAEPITSRGFTFMDTPGYDPISVTGLVAGGCQIVVFTTGRGSCFGCKPAPTIKVSTNTQLFDRMRDDMDINAGSIIDGESVESAGTRLFEQIVAVASGKQTLSEQQGIGDEEFCPWMPGPIF
ncbi:MAG: Altronate dehydratase [Planctomycetota bacterium]|jgi:altronate hydrolase